MLHRPRDLLMRQRAQLIDALRAQLAEFGITGRDGIKELLAIVEQERSFAGILIPGDPSESIRAVLNGVRVCQRALHDSEIASSFVTENMLKGRLLPPWKSLACPCLVTP